MVSHGRSISRNFIDMKYFWIALLIYWVLCVMLAFRKGIFVEQLRKDLPQLFILPLWMRTAILFLVFMVIAPMMLKEPIDYVREKWAEMKLWFVSRRLRKMANNKKLAGNAELADDLRRIAEGLDEITKL